MSIQKQIDGVAITVSDRGTRKGRRFLNVKISVTASDIELSTILAARQVMPSISQYLQKTIGRDVVAYASMGSDILERIPTDVSLDTALPSHSPTSRDNSKKS